MSFEEALKLAISGKAAEAAHYFNSEAMPSLALSLKEDRIIEYFYDDGLPWTSLRREFTVEHNGKLLTAWWEEYNGYYGGGGTGCWVEEVDGDGPPDGLKELLREVGIIIPQAEVPSPPQFSEGDEE